MAHASAKIWLLSAAALLVGTTACWAETLTQAIQASLRNNPEIQALKADARASGYGIEVSSSALGPTVSTSAEAVASTKESSNGWAATLSASQNIYDGGASQGELRRTESVHKATVSRLREQSALGALEAAKAYMEVQRSRGIVHILEQNLASLKSLQKRVRLRVEAGVSNEVELYNTASKIDAAKVNLIDAKSQLADAVAAYQIVIGHLPGALETVRVPVRLLPESASEAARLAQGYSPRILAVRYDALAADAVADASSAANRPKIDLSISASHSDGFDKQYNAADELSAQIGLRFNLYDGGAAKARVKQAMSSAAAARARVKIEANSAKLEVVTAMNAVQIEGQKVAILKSQLANTRRTFELSRKRYNAGVTPLSEILDLNTSVAAAEAAWLNAEFAQRYNVYRVLAATGRLHKSLEPRTIEVASAQ